MSANHPKVKRLSKYLAPALVMFVAIGCLLRANTLAARASSNLGMLVLQRALSNTAHTRSASDPYTLFAKLPNEGESLRAWFRRAMILDKDSATVRWGAGRVALALGDAPSAAIALEPLAAQAGQNPLLDYDLLIAFSYGGRPEQVVNLYESSFSFQRTQLVSDTVALAYLDESRRMEGQPRRETLQKALALRPGDLYANYALWQAAQEAVELPAAAVYSETLVYFPLAAIHPADERLLEYTVEVIPALLGDGLWDREKTLNVVSYLVWQQSESASVERLLVQLVERHPAEPDWLFYLAELYHRQGHFDQAELVYRRALQVDAMYAPAYLRLGLVAEAQSMTPGSQLRESMEEAAGWYEHYRMLAPDDLLGMKKLVKTYEMLGRSEVTTLGGELEARTDDRQIAAVLLGVPVEQVELGPNLVANGGFEVWTDKRPAGWMVSDMATGSPWNRGRFVQGADGLDVWDGIAARIEGLWLEPLSHKEPGRFGLWAWDEAQKDLQHIYLDAQRSYLIAITYRTQGVPDGKVTLWLTGDVTNALDREIGLPSTGGQWRRFARILCNPLYEPATIEPLVRIWTQGNVWLGDVTIRRVHGATGLCPSLSREDSR